MADLLDLLFDEQIGALQIADSDYHLRVRGGNAALLDNARKGLPIHGEGPSNAKAYYRLVSGRAQEYFLSIWELLDNATIVKQLSEALASRIQALFAVQATTFSAIAVSTPTERALLGILLPELVLNGLQFETIDVSTPWRRTSNNRSRVNLTAGRVLILTDVIASGRALRQTARELRARGRNPIAALAVIVTGPKLLREAQLRLGGESPPIALHWLVAVETPSIVRNQEPGEIPIDPFRIFPAGSDAHREAPSCPAPTMYRILEEADALDFGLFQTPWYHTQTAIRIDRLLTHQEFIKAVADLLSLSSSPKTVVVTLQDTAEWALRKHFEQVLPGKQWISLPHQVSPEGLETFFLLPSHEMTLTGRRDALVLLSAVQRADRVRDIVTLLAAVGVEKITVVVIADKMPTRTAGFTTRLRYLERSLKVSGKTEVYFKPLFTIQELDSSILLNLVEVVRYAEEHYREGSTNPGYRDLLAHELKYFNALRVDSFQVQTGTQTRLVNMHYPEPAVVATTGYYGVSASAAYDTYAPASVEGRLSLVTSLAITDKRYDQLIGLIGDLAIGGTHHPRIKELFYRAVTVALADIDYLKHTDWIGKILRTLSQARELLRAQRRSLQLDQLAEARYLVERESYVVVAMALIGYAAALPIRGLAADFLAQRPFYCADPAAKEGHSAGQRPLLERDPINSGELVFYLTDRVWWTASLLLLLPPKEGDSKMRDEVLIGELSAVAKELLALLQTDTPTLARFFETFLRAEGLAVTDWPTERRRHFVESTIQDFATQLILEIRGQRPRRPHQIIRYLFRHIYDRGAHHNWIWTHLEAAIAALDSLSAPVKRMGGVQVYLHEQDHKQALENAITALGDLRKIAGAVKDFIRITPYPFGAEARHTYAENGKMSPLQQWVEELSDLLFRLRKTGRIALENVFRLTDLWTTITSWLHPRERLSEEMRLALGEYLVPLQQVIRDGLERGAQLLGERADALERFRVRLDSDGLEFLFASGEVEGLSQIVLGEPLFLREFLGNVFSNVRHGVPETADLASLVEISIAPDRQFLENELKEVWKISVGRASYFGEPTEGRRSLAKQAVDLERLGGKLTFPKVPDGWRCDVYLLARSELGSRPRGWPEDSDMDSLVVDQGREEQ
jgi:orotate phosphoribosyltransferase